VTRQLLSGSNRSTAVPFPSFSPAHRREVNQVLKLSNLFASLPRREEGQTMAEYGVVLAVITIAVFAALFLLSGNIVAGITAVADLIAP
jgi:Flp pilus assembly pilin Flp